MRNIVGQKAHVLLCQISYKGNGLDRWRLGNLFIEPPFKPPHDSIYSLMVIAAQTRQFLLEIDVLLEIDASIARIFILKLETV